MSTPTPISHVTVGVLGLLTIASYGSWFYSFGVLLDPIIIDTGWREGTLAASFSAGVLIVGLGSVIGGRLLDRVGTGPVFLMGAVLGGGSLLAASWADNVYTFAVVSAVGLGVMGALGQYHITMTAAVRSSPASPGHAIAVLTIYGAFASPIYLPLTAWFVENHGWRITTRVLAVSGIAAFLVAAVVARVPPDPGSERATPSIRAVARSTVAGPSARAFTIAVALAGIAVSTLLIYQVPLMVAAGLPLGTAATVAAVRGFAQLTGRIRLTPMVRALGARIALVVALVALAVGVLLLLFAGSLPVAIAFALIAGFGVGAYSPLQGIYSEELFERQTLGTTMGVLSSINMLAGATGPLVAGLLSDTTGNREWAIALAVAAALGAAALLVRDGQTIKTEFPPST